MMARHFQGDVKECIVDIITKPNKSWAKRKKKNTIQYPETTLYRTHDHSSHMILPYCIKKDTILHKFCNLFLLNDH